MVVIDSGHFVMGSPTHEEGRMVTEGPMHTVTIVKPFALGRCEVTVGEFRRFIRETRYVTLAERKGGCNVWSTGTKTWEQRAEANWDNPGFEQTESHPVVCVSFEDVLAYLDWISQRTGQRYRLPSEAEWEYAARAGTTTARYWSDAANAACRYANVLDQKAQSQFAGSAIHACDDGFVYTAPVGTFTANACGLFDMIGNVWEWTQDCWHVKYEGALVNGAAWEDANEGFCNWRVVRGGSWFNGPESARSSFRIRYATDGVDSVQGFRLARTL
jgi:formylglycine-generating enzyme required for sulfatase activity